MELIWTDSNGRELGYIQNANIDMEIGEDEKDSINDFEIEFARRNWNGELVGAGFMFQGVNLEEL